MIKQLTLLSVFLCTAFCYKEPHEFFVEQKICNVNMSKNYDDFFKVVKLTCDWIRFFESEQRAPELESPKPNLVVLYEFKFELRNNAGSLDPKYLHVRKNFLKNFKVRSLVLRSLGLISIDESAFAKANFASLETLDLSLNALSRLDSHILEHMHQLQNLNLANNKDLKLSEKNFAQNTYLRRIDLSYNRLQFITPNLFQNLNQLESVDLSANSLRSVKACDFNNVQTNELSRKFSPVVINLKLNPINCDCDVFYLERHMNFKVEVECEKPLEYKGKSLKQLSREDPAYRCEYEKMSVACSVKPSISDRDLTLIIVFASLTGLFLLLACCCYCKSSSQSSKIKHLRADLEHRIQESKPKKVYANINLLEKQKSGDAQALIQH